jgi:hypothetical protein
MFDKLKRSGQNVEKASGYCVRERFRAVDCTALKMVQLE